MTIGCSVKKSTALRLERSWVQLARSSLKKFWCIGSSATALNKSVHKTTYDYINILQEVYIPVLMWLKFMKIWGWKNHGKVIIHTFFFRRKQFSIEFNSPTFFFRKRHQKFQNNSWSLPFARPVCGGEEPLQDVMKTCALLKIESWGVQFLPVFGESVLVGCNVTN